MFAGAGTGAEKSQGAELDSKARCSAWGGTMRLRRGGFDRTGRGQAAVHCRLQLLKDLPMGRRGLKAATHGSMGLRGGDTRKKQSDGRGRKELG